MLNVWHIAEQVDLEVLGYSQDNGSRKPCLILQRTLLSINVEMILSRMELVASTGLPVYIGIDHLSNVLNA